MSTPRVAIVGAGLMGRWHAVYARRAGARIVAVVDRDGARARALARRFPGARALAAEKDWPRQSGAEVVHVCTSLDSHAALAEAALEAGLHALVEKPLAPSLVACERLFELARVRRRRLAAVHQMPFQRGVRQLCARRAELGAPVAVRYRAFTAGGAALDAAACRRLGLEILPHALSLFGAVGLGGVAPEAWRWLRHDEGGLELAAERGGVGLGIEISLRARPPRQELTYAAEGGTAIADLYHGYAVFEPPRGGRAAKAVRPFGHGGGLLAAAAWNLLLRALRRQGAYPGLPELIAAFYRSLEPVGGAAAEVVPAEVVLAAAALAEIGERRAASARPAVRRK